MLREIIYTDRSKAIILIRIMVGFVFLSEGIQKFLFPEIDGVWSDSLQLDFRILLFMLPLSDPLKSSAVFYCCSDFSAAPLHLRCSSIFQ